MCKAKGEFTFHRAGHGLFYSGVITAENAAKKFNFVYDCGTMPKRREKFDFDAQIDAYKESIDNKLDMLVISHFHEDHVNGLEKLLKGGVTPKVVIMPYISDSERATIIFSRKIKEEFLLEFYEDPVMWFVHRGVEKIILIREKPGDEPGEMMLQDDMSGTLISRKQVKDTLIITMAGKVELLIPEFRWIFEFESVDFESTEEYEKKLEKFMKGKSIKELLKKNTLKSLRKEFGKEKLGKDYNNLTSVIMLHGPQNEMVKKEQNPQNERVKKAQEQQFKYRNFSILMGDAKIARKKVDMFESYKKGRCYICQYPHHGGNGCGIRKIKKFATSYVICFCDGTGRPSEKVKEGLSGKIIEVTEMKPKKPGTDGFIYEIPRRVHR